MRRVLRLAISVLVACGLVISGSSVAQAVETRPGAKPLQIDILLGPDTQRLSTADWWAAAVECSPAYGLGVTFGGAVAARAPHPATRVGLPVGFGAMAEAWCMSTLTVCAAQAAAAGKWGGMTIGVNGPWCWKY